MSDIPERDWKYLRSIKDEMLETLCKRINDEASRIVTSKSGSQHDKYLRLFKHVMDHDDNMGHCFNDWRRSNIGGSGVLSIVRDFAKSGPHSGYLHASTADITYLGIRYSAARSKGQLDYRVDTAGGYQPS